MRFETRDRARWLFDICYSPIAVIFEKLRAICQQMEEYSQIVRTHRRKRAKDFFDICMIMDEWATAIELEKEENLDILKQIFEIKEVPLEFLKNIEREREYHRDDFNSVKEVVSKDVQIRDYDYYVDIVVEKTKKLQALWGI